MRIEITQRLSPFSHKPGTFFLLAGTALQVQVFPTRLFFTNLNQENSTWALDVDLTGPHKDFTVEQRIESGKIIIFSHTAEGYVRYQISAVDEGIELFCEKSPPQGLRFSSPEKSVVLLPKEKYTLSLPMQKKTPAVLEKLSLGIHKKQNWEGVLQRKLLEEIFPFWFSLSQMVPFSQEEPVPEGGTALLFKRCEEALRKKEKLSLYGRFLQFFEGSFEGVFSPRNEEVNFLGLLPKESKKGDFSPLLLLAKSYPLLRSLFFVEENDHFFFLPCLPPEFFSGKLVDIHTKEGDVLHFEWVKKHLRCVKIIPGKSRGIFIHTPGKTLFRVRSSLKDLGKEVMMNTPISLEEKKTYYFDRFQN